MLNHGIGAVLCPVNVITSHLKLSRGDMIDTVNIVIEITKFLNSPIVGLEIFYLLFLVN